MPSSVDFMWFRKKGKKGVEWELGKMIVALVVLVVIALGLILLFKVKGGGLLAAIKSMMRLGR